MKYHGIPIDTRQTPVNRQSQEENCNFNRFANCGENKNQRLANIYLLAKLVASCSMQGK